MTDLDELKQKVEQVEDAIWASRLERQQLKDMLTAMQSSLAEHVRREEEYWKFVKEMQQDLGKRVGVLEAAKHYAEGAKSFLEWIVKYGWAILVFSVGAVYWYLKERGL